MINAAFILGVSSYTDELHNLPACKRDAEVINSLLTASGRFQNIVLVNDITTKLAVETALTEFFISLRDKDVDELFLYYSGHGEMFDDDFLFLMSDYAVRKRRQTSLSNDEIDTLVRKVSPKVFVKIVDACQSGKSYIKSADAIPSLRVDKENSLKSLYFLFSSQASQSSYSGPDLSEFTESIVRSIYTTTANPIRYKDIIAAVADDFDNRGSQRPLFVNQSTMLEVFAENTSELYGIAESYINTGAPPLASNTTSLTLLQKIRMDAEQYCSQSEAEETIAKLADAFDAFSLKSELDEIFEYRVMTSLNKEALPNGSFIGKWLEKNDAGPQKTFFAEPLMRTEQYERVDPTDIARFNVFASMRGEEPRKILATRNVIKGYKDTSQVDDTCFVIHATPNLPNIPASICFIVLILSKIELVSFYAFGTFVQEGWDSTSYPKTVEWNIMRNKMKDEKMVDEITQTILGSFRDFIETPIKRQWGADHIDGAVP